MKSKHEPDELWRRQRLAEALRKFFGNNKAEMGRQLGYDSGALVHQMLEGIRPITEKTVRKIEALPGLHAWFEKPVEGGLVINDEAEIAMIMNFRRWVAEQQKAAAAALSPKTPLDGNGPPKPGKPAEHEPSKRRK